MVTKQNPTWMEQWSRSQNLLPSQPLPLGGLGKPFYMNGAIQ